MLNESYSYHRQTIAHHSSGQFMNKVGSPIAKVGTMDNSTIKEILHTLHRAVKKSTS
ncbi:MAG: hypothetical protein P2A85_12595 [Microcoleus anatoxicus]|uniref:hypothetical protein n=1 Tax=Microcoleus anatoxicus TaxID=2705319 RepID=UPI00366DD470